MAEPRPTRVLFAGASMERDWQGGEPVFADLLERGLAERGLKIEREGSRRGLAGFLALGLMPHDFEPRRLFAYRRRLRRSKPDVILTFYDFDSSLVLAAHQEGVPVIACAQIYWPTCPIGTHYIEGVGTCYTLELGKCLRHIANSPISPNLELPVPALPAPLGLLLYSKVVARRSVLSLADAIAANSEFMAGVLRRGGFSRVHAIHNGVDLDLFRPTPWTGSSKVVLYPVARSLQERKGYPHFVQLAATIRRRMPDVRFKILSHAGDGFIEGTPYLNRQEMAEEFRQDYLAVVPGLWDEPFGLVAAEAMAAGRPVVAYATGGLPEIIEDGVSGVLVPPGRQDRLVEAVDGLLRNEDAARKMGEAARARAEKRFGFRLTAERYLSLIDRVMNQGPVAG